MLLDKWIERFPNGDGMVTKFTASAMVSYSVDSTGKSVAPVQPSAMSYRDLDAQTIVLDFPGTGSHRLVRVPP